MFNRLAGDITVRQSLKNGAGAIVASLLPSCRYDRLIVMIAHMRSGSTALSNIICEHPAVSGFGESHIRYEGRHTLGILALSQWRRGALRPSARHLYDKITHSEYDDDPASGLTTARAVFLARNPAHTLPSIQRVYAHIGSREFESIDTCAAYYVERLEDMFERWRRYPPGRRVAIAYEDLVAEPDRQIGRISRMLEMTPALRNAYTSRPASIRANAGDPLASTQHQAITPIPAAGGAAPDSLDGLALTPARRNQLAEVYDRYRALCRDAETEGRPGAA